MAQAYKNFIFRNMVGMPTILGKGTPTFRKQYSGNMVSLS